MKGFVLQIKSHVNHRTFNPHTDCWGPCGPQKTLIVAPTVIIGTLEPISFIPAHTVFGVRWTPQIPEV